MLDISSISAVVAAVGVLVGVVLTVLELRHLFKQRQMELVVELSSQVRSREYRESLSEVMSAEFKDYDDFVKKYGSPFTSRDSVSVSLQIVGTFCEELGVLLKNGLIDPNLVSQLFFVAPLWEKLKPIAEGLRKQHPNPHIY